MYILAATNISEDTEFAKFAKYNSTPKFVDLQYTSKLHEWESQGQGHSVARFLHVLEVVMLRSTASDWLKGFALRSCAFAQERVTRWNLFLW